MPDTIMTMGRIHEVAYIRGTANAPVGGDFRRIAFHCGFTPNALNSGSVEAAPKPEVRVSISTRAAAHTYTVQVATAEGINGALARESRSQVDDIAWIRPVTWMPSGLVVGERRATRREIGESRWERDDWLDDNPHDIFEPVDPPDHGGGGGYSVVFRRTIDLESDPVGTWVATVRNTGHEDAEFRILVQFPETVQRLEETRIPFQLINRVFAQALLSMQLSIRIHRENAAISFDPTFKKLTGLQNLSIRIPDYLRETNLVSFTIRMGRSGVLPAVLIGLDLDLLEQELQTGIAGTSVDMSDVAICCRLLFFQGYARGPEFFKTAMTRMDGKVEVEQTAVSSVLDVNVDISGKWAAVLDIIATLLFQSDTQERVEEVIDKADMALRIEMGKLSPYVHDVLMHLVRRGDIMYSLTADDEGIVVRHHRRPNARNLMEGMGSVPDGETALTERGFIESEEVRWSSFESENEVVGGDAAPVVPQDFDARIEGEGSRSRRTESWRRKGAQESHKVDHIVVLMLENRLDICTSTIPKSTDSRAANLIALSKRLRIPSTTCL